MTQIGRWAKAAAVAALVGGLAACGGGSDDRAETAAESDVIERSSREQAAIDRRERERQRIAEGNLEDFTYYRYRIATDTEQPLACFVFSSALDPEADYSPYVDFRPNFRPALSVSGRELCVGGLEFGTSRTAILKSGLPAEDGRTLERGEEIPIDFADRPPYVGFAGSGIILPRENADGLAVETVNVDQVRITVSRVDERALYAKRLSNGRTESEGRYSYIYGDESPRDVSEQLWSGVMDIAAEPNAPITTVFPLQDVIGELEPGSYYVEIEDAKELSASAGPPASSQRWIMMTDLAMTAYRGEHGLDLTVRSLQDGKAVPGVTVQLVARNNDILAEAEADSSGRVRFDKPILSGSGNTSPKLVQAFGARGDFALLDLTRAPVEFADGDTGGRRTPGAVDTYLYTERGIYRPGETVHVTSLLRTREAVAVADRPGALVIFKPNGLEAYRSRFDTAEAGALQTSYDLPRAATRGVWRAAVEIDGIGETGSVGFSVEDFVPQRIAVELEADSETPIRTNESREIEVDARFLYGAPGAGLIVQSQARIEPDPSPFEAYSGFRFGRQGEYFREEIIEFPDQTADGAGKALVRIEPGTRAANADRPLRVNTVVSVLEPGGRAVSESERIPYRPRDLYVGIRKNFDGRAAEGADNLFEVAAVGADGEAKAARLEWKVLLTNYHYDWYREDGDWRWRRSRTVEEVQSGVVSTPKGGTGEITLSGLDWGSYELIIEGPDEVGASTRFYTGWGGEVSGDGVEAPDRVQVSGPDEGVQPGRSVNVNITAPYEGEAQIVVATDRVLSVFNRAVQAGGQNVTVPVTDEWGEGAYVMVNVFTERDPLLSAKPRRAVGVAYVPVDNSRRTFDLTIKAPDVARPRREQLIEVDIEGGPRERVFLTLAAVDEGILRLTKFNSPNPVDYFFGKKALGVDQYDDYGRLLDPNLGAPSEVRTGGDQLGGEGLSVVPTKTVALFSGIVEVGRTGEASIRFDVPDFNGELRLMAVAWSETGLGAAESKMTVRDRAPSDLVMPRFLAPGDEAVITASIDNVELEAGAFSAEVNAEGVVEASGGRLSRTLPQGERADIPVRISASDTGISDVSLDVSGPDNFSVVHDYQIETRSPYLPITRIDTDLMEPGESYALSASLLDGFVPGSTNVTVTYSSLPVDAGALYASLARYPYGCTEQTVSRALPLLYSDQLVAMGADGDKDSAQIRVQEAVSSILNRQSADGAFGLWREGDRNATPWLGAYTTDFIYRAKEAGYAVPQEALDRAYDVMRNIAEGDAWRVYGYDTDVWESRWHADTEAKLMRRSAPFALYVLAKAGEADITRLRYLHDRELDEIINPLAKAHLAAALAYMGDRARAKNAFDAAEAAVGYRNSGDYYQTPLRDIAGILALAAETDFNDHVVRMSETLGLDAPDPAALTTQEKAFLLMAVNGLTKGEADGFTLDVEGIGDGNDNDRRYIFSEDQVSEDVVFTLASEAAVFRTVMVYGSPASPPSAAESRLAVRKQIRTLNGERVSFSDITQGDQFVVSITLDPEERRVNPVIVADLLPAGFEIETILRRSDGAIAQGDDGAFAWVGEITSGKTAEARDDRFVAAVDLVDETQTLAYIVRAVTPGDFAIPGATAEDMYRPSVFARSEPGRITIAPRGGSTAGTP